jgi:hypothetical protein
MSFMTDEQRDALERELQRLSALASDAIERGATTDEVLAVLRHAGAQPVLSMAILCRTTGISLADAKKAVWLSPVWAPERPQQERLEAEILRVLGTEMAPHSTK